MDISLSWYEQINAETCGNLRRDESVGKRSKRGIHTKDDDKLRKNDVEAAGAEMAAAKALNTYWHGSVNAGKNEPDIGRNTQVRFTQRKNGCLIIAPGDPTDQTYVLVVGQWPDYKVVGYTKNVKELMRDEYLKAPNNRPAAHFIPQKELKKI